MEWSKVKGVDKQRIRTQGRNTCAWMMMMSVHAYKCNALTYCTYLIQAIRVDGNTNKQEQEQEHGHVQELRGEVAT